MFCPASGTRVCARPCCPSCRACSQGERPKSPSDCGTSEVVYADECFVRVYNGQTGDVLFSQYHSSCTWYENPIIADTDGNFRADLVVPSNKACSPGGVGKACTML